MEEVAESYDKSFTFYFSFHLIEELSETGIFSVDGPGMSTVDWFAMLPVQRRNWYWYGVAV